MRDDASSMAVAMLAERLGPRGFTSDPADMAPWLTDWRGRFTGAARAMLSPATVDDVQAIVRVAAEHCLPVVPQGGNTSMVAGATPDAGGDALLLSTRRLRHIRHVSAEDDVAVVEAGVTLADLHDAAAAGHRRFPLSLAAKGSATVGGLVSTNAGGTQVLRFGTMRGLVLGIEAVLPSGERFDGLAPLPKDNRGYDLRHLLIGAEGTLGIVTAASLRLVPAVATRTVAWVGLATPDRALALLRRLQATMRDALESFEIVPAVALDLVLRHVPGTRAPLSARHAWNLLIEATGPDEATDPRTPLEALLAAALEDGLIDDAVVAASVAQADAFWKLRESISAAERADGVAAKHDVSVPVAAMPAFLVAGARAVEARFPGVRVIAFGHLGDGNVHFNVRAPQGADARLWFDTDGGAVNAFVHDLVAAKGGSLSAEHGIGQTKRAELGRTGGTARIATLRAIKAALDPAGIMNPGKLVP